VGLLFADDLAVGATTIIGLQRVISCTKDFCEEWSLKINVAKTKIVVFKKGGKPSRDEKWQLGGEEIEVVTEIKYLGIVLDSRGKWEKERKQVAIRGKSVLNSINICVARAPNIEVKVLEQLYNTLVESHMMTEVEILGLEDGWKEIGEVHELFCEKSIGNVKHGRKWIVCERTGRKK
jgi:hypothetical protein